LPIARRDASALSEHTMSRDVSPAPVHYSSIFHQRHRDSTMVIRRLYNAEVKLKISRVTIAADIGSNREQGRLSIRAGKR
jgi:hypothetical protein